MGMEQLIYLFKRCFPVSECVKWEWMEWSSWSFFCTLSASLFSSSCSSSSSQSHTLFTLFRDQIAAASFDFQNGVCLNMLHRSLDFRRLFSISHAREHTMMPHYIQHVVFSAPFMTSWNVLRSFLGILFIRKLQLFMDKWFLC